MLLYGAIRELLVNVARHARTDVATIRMSRPDCSRACISVSDEGAGFDPAELLDGGSDSVADSCFGLFSIRERLELLGGRLQINSRPGCGTQVMVIAPLCKPSA